METVRLSLVAAWDLLRNGFVLGAGLPIVFALGVRLWAGGDTDDVTAAGGTAAAGPSVAAKVGAAVCFLLVILAVVIGIEIIVASGLGKVVSFEHIYPTLVPKD